MSDVNEIEEYYKSHITGSGFWPFIKRRWLEFTTINPQNTQAKLLLKSSTGIKTETLRHLFFYRNVIHCFSQFR